MGDRTLTNGTSSEESVSEFIELTLVTDGPVWGGATVTPPSVIETCCFGHSGGRVQACDRDAIEGDTHCVVHADRF